MTNTASAVLALASVVAGNSDSTSSAAAPADAKDPKWTVLDLPPDQKLGNTFSVPSADTLNEGGKKYTVYHVKVKGAHKMDDPKDVAAKRFSAFQDFDKLLRKLFPSYMTAITFPPIRMFGNFDVAVIEERRRAFTKWLDDIVQHREMWPALATWLDVPLDKWRQ